MQELFTEPLTRDQALRSTPCALSHGFCTVGGSSPVLQVRQPKSALSVSGRAPFYLP